MRIGPHLSIAKGLPAAVEAALSIGATTFQFFSRNPRGGSQRALDAQELRRWFALKREHDLGPLVMHIPYTVNLAAPADATWEFAVRVLREDTERAAAVGASFIVTHPGSHTKQSDPAQGIRRIVAALGEVREVVEALHARPPGDPGARRADEPPAPWILLETMSGQGTEIGHHPEQLREIFVGLDWPSWLGVCVDTCHVFAAGYDLRSPDEVDRLAADLDRHLGLDRVRVVHVNDSKAPAGSRIDRHECVDRGEIGLDGLLNLIEHPAFSGRPLILETPVETMPDGWGDEIRLLRSAVGARGSR